MGDCHLGSMLVQSRWRSRHPNATHGLVDGSNQACFHGADPPKNLAEKKQQRNSSSNHQGSNVTSKTLQEEYTRFYRA
ncbi:hypothetical protein FH972_010829 [Carpinus fangiana]|uniref:Uncharacterized protein n=1 Tax=Carpinus fangiana TaxID=176857 RepID=A0A660KR77_9ROSI|nr:hypothetical protein FH972_010829 [Carpinus fangiana]